MTKVVVPLKISHTVVGSAHIYEDGTIQLIMHGPSALGKEILELCRRANMVEALTLGVDFLPPHPPRNEGLDHPRIHHFPHRGNPDYND